MKIRIKTIQRSSLMIAAGVWLVSLVSFAVAIALTRGASWLWLLCGVPVLLAAYLLSNTIITKFVIYKIKPIFQIVFARNIRTSELESEMVGKDDLVEDISNQLSAWAENNRREIARLKETEKYRKEFIGNVSHELKTPIFNIQGYITTLLDGALDDQTINRKYLARSEKSIDRLINIVNDLDEISKLESGVLQLDMERFDVVELTREVMDVVEFEARRKRIRISIEEPSSLQPVMVMADKHYIEQVLINLLTNSVRYGNEGGRTQIAFIDMFDKVMVEVSDNGVGISKEDIPRVFERFFRTDKSRSREQGGTGLGLAIVKHVIEAHNENITLRSELGVGSTFSFTLSKNKK